MTRFNKPAPRAVPKINRAGGRVYEASDRWKLTSLVLTSFLTDQPYRTGTQALDELRTLVRKNDPLYAAKLAVFARRVYGMRSVSHAIAAELAGVEHVPPQFFYHVVFRPDDLLEILALYWQWNPKPSTSKSKRTNAPLPYRVKRGFRKALEVMSPYALAKYAASGNAICLQDVVRLLHPRASELNREALALLADKSERGGMLKSTSWQAAISATGQSGASTDKAAEWTRLVTTRELGYFALLRNLRNILLHAPEAVDAACQQLTNPEAVRRSLVLPFRFLTARDTISEVTSCDPMLRNQVLGAIEQAIDLSVSNVPTLTGRTLVAIDCSGSMGIPHPSGHFAKAALFGAALFQAQAGMAVVRLWSDDNKPVLDIPISPSNSVTGLVDTLKQAALKHGGGTNITLPFLRLQSLPAYDRIFILTDEESWAHHNRPGSAWESYRKYAPDCRLYVWNLAGLGSLAFPENRVTLLAGFSEQVFDLIQTIESTDGLAGMQALAKRVEAVNLNHWTPLRLREPVAQQHEETNE